MIYKSVYFLDDNQKLIRVVHPKHLIQVIQEKEITDDKSELLNDQLSVALVYDYSIQNAAYMAVRENDRSFSVYSILDSDDPDNKNEFVGINFAVKELEGFIVKDIRPQNKTISYIANQILQTTEGEWRLGYVKPNLPIISENFYYLSVKDSFKQLQEHGVEVLFKCRIDNNRIVDKWVEIYDQIGEPSKERFVYGKSALSIIKEIDRSSIYTSLIGRGKGEQVGDGYGRRIEFSDIEWKKPTHPENKSKGQNFIEIPEMTQKYGIPLKNGTKRKREGVVVFDEIEDPEELLKSTYDHLVSISRPLVQFRTEVFNGDSIGNIIPIIRYDRGYKYKARIFYSKINRLTGKVECHVGDNLTKKSSTRISSDLKADIEKVENEKVSFTTAEQVAQWQTDIIRGLRGGSYIVLTEADLGISEERVPYCSVWMNKKSLETSDHFLVANSEGIGFIDGDFNLDNFHSAWTIDGVLNARFIQVGRLSGEQLFLDLDTGEVFFGKGSINSLNGDLKIDITNGIIEGPIIRSTTKGNFTATLQIQNGTMYMMDNNGVTLGRVGTSNILGKEMVITNKQGKELIIGTEQNNVLGAVMKIPSNSTSSSPILEHYGTQVFKNSKVDFGLGTVKIPIEINSDGTVARWYNVNW